MDTALLTYMQSRLVLIKKVGCGGRWVGGVAANATRRRRPRKVIQHRANGSTKIVRGVWGGLGPLPASNTRQPPIVNPKEIK